MPTTLATRVAFEWKPWTAGLTWKGLVLFALFDTLSKRATFDELCEVIGTHPHTLGEPLWKEKVREALESPPHAFVLDEHGRWTFTDEDYAREAVRFCAVDGPEKWENHIPAEVRRTIDALWSQHRAA